MINVQVRGESGTIEARAEHGVVWSPELAGLDQSVFPMFAHELVELCQMVLGGQHLYLWFLGD